MRGRLRERKRRKKKLKERKITVAVRGKKSSWREMGVMRKIGQREDLVAQSIKAQGKCRVAAQAIRHNGRATSPPHCIVLQLFIAIYDMYQTMSID